MTNVLTTGLLTLGMFAGVVLAPPDNAATSEPDWTPVTVFFQSCTPFNECCTGDGCCITGYHTVRGSGDPTTEDTPHPCSNNNSHPCDEHDCEAEEQQDLEALFAMASVDAVRDLLRAHPANLFVNRAREAIQIIGCSGLIEAQVNLRSEFLEAVLAVE